MDDLKNPVVLLSGATWHIVEHSRRSRQAWCGKALRERRAHARLSVVGKENVCPRCLARFRAAHASSDQG